MKKTHRLLIVANGEPVGKTKALSLAERADFIIAADGGVVCCRDYGIDPDILIGDLDSARTLDPPFPKEKTIHNPDQYSTDMEKALALAREKAPQRIDVINAFGKRTDHTLGNLFFLYSFDYSGTLYMHDDNGSMCRLGPGKHTLKGLRGRTVSIFAPLPVMNLRISGFAWPLQEEKLEPMFVGVSNVIEEDEAAIEIGEGSLFFYLLDGEGI